MKQIVQDTGIYSATEAVKNRISISIFSSKTILYKKSNVRDEARTEIHVCGYRAVPHFIDRRNRHQIPERYEIVIPKKSTCCITTRMIMPHRD